MKHYNQVIVLGWLKNKEEIKEPPLVKTKHINFDIKVERYSRGGEVRTEDILPCVAYNQLAEIVNDYAEEDSSVLLRGQLQSMSDGIKVYVESLNVLQYKGGKRNEDQ